MTPMTDPLHTPSRRELLLALASLGALAITGCGGDQSVPAVAPPAPSVPGATMLRMSRQGSNRGTAYLQDNKVLSLPDGSTLVTYLESHGSRVVVILEQLDRQLTGVFRMAVGLAVNNHRGASMALDSQQVLHIVYGPHGGPMRYRRNQKASAWFELGAEQKFGGMLTYPSLVVDAKDRLWVAAREGSGSQRAKGTMEVWAMHARGVFHRIAKPLVNRKVGYAAFNPSLHIDTQGRLYLTATIHEGTDELAYGHQAITYLTSDDAGATWKNARQEVLKLPATVAEAGAIYEGGMLVKKIVNGGMVTTDASGQVMAHFHIEYVDQNRSSLMLARLDKGLWQLDDLRQLCDVPAGHEFCDPGVMCVHGTTITFASVMQNVALADRSPFHGAAWGHASNRVAIGRFNLSTRTGQFKLLPADGSLERPLLVAQHAASHPSGRRCRGTRHRHLHTRQSRRGLLGGRTRCLCPPSGLLTSAPSTDR